MNFSDFNKDYSPILLKKDQVKPDDLESTKKQRCHAWAKQAATREYTSLDSSFADFEYISTGITTLDGMLEGGIEVNSITEIIGPAKSKKSKLCFAIVAHIVATTDRKIFFLYSDTPENTLYPLQRDIENKIGAKTPDNKNNQKFENLQIVNVTKASKLLNYLEHYLEKETNQEVLLQDSSSLGDLIVIDNIAEMVYTDSNKKNTIIQAQLTSLHRYLHRIVRVGNCAILIVNGSSVIHDIDNRKNTEKQLEPNNNKFPELERNLVRGQISEMQNISNYTTEIENTLAAASRVKPMLGLNWQYVAHHRLFLSKIKMDDTQRLHQIRCVLTRSVNLFAILKISRSNQ
ncbi:hypothetical protein BB561_000752 [Smittium simulii]|uniref:Rad51-like C-terminal domain-containing protein n=1 Tax=Smittium simulii TaxID=133385 RepID=A0A2T9YXR4_9FUNG|nr:hypothetical protein BB561_000752 [Smittium simulii]